MKIETRFIPVSATEIRAAAKEGGGWTLSALGVPFNQLSLDLGGWFEEFSPDAFRDLKAQDVYSTFNHNPSMILARVSAGSLSLEVRKDGLHYDAEPTDTSYSRDLRTNIDGKLVKGSSIQFVALNDVIRTRKVDGSEIVVRTVTEAELYELGPVTDPAYVQTTAEASGRAMERRVREWLEQQKAPPEEIAARFGRDRERELELRRMELSL